MTQNAILLALLLSSLGCSDAARASCEPLGAARDPLINGSSEHTLVALSTEQVAAIVPVADAVPGAQRLCTGSVVAPSWVLTAKHCLAMVEPSVNGVAVVETRPHPERDVALLRLAAPLDGTWPLKLQQGALAEELLGREVELAGYGLTEASDAGALKFLIEPIVEVTPSALRVSGLGSSGACLGDSGGPLLLSSATGETLIAGVLSRGSSSCVHEDSYVRTSTFAQWVQTNTGATEAGRSNRCLKDQFLP